MAETFDSKHERLRSLQESTEAMWGEVDALSARISGVDAALWDVTMRLAVSNRRTARTCARLASGERGLGARSA